MPTQEKLEGTLNLDPGTPPRRKSSISGCKCLVITVAIIIILVIGLSISIFVLKVVDNVANPHRALYQNTSLEDVKNRTLVVQPLITREQTFDVGVTVWLRATDKVWHGEAAVREALRKKSSDQIGGTLKKNVEDDSEAKGDPPKDEISQEYDDEVPEIALYSDLAFRGIRLTDKHVFATINFTLPTAIFRSANLSNFDLRGSFILIPTSPSPLNHLSNFSTWRPNTIKTFPVRAWPFPLGSPDLHEKTLADQAVESFGASIPLIKFHGIHTRCNASNGEALEEIMGDSTDEDEEDEEIDTDRPDKSDPTGKKNTILETLEITNNKPILKTHPYIVTRTQLHVVDETRILNRKAYSKAHRQIKATACGQRIVDGPRPNKFLCKRSYSTHGNLETQMQLAVLNESSGRMQTEWAYSPYISASKDSVGPKNLLAIPVNREKCTRPGTVTSTSNAPPEQDFLDVMWKITYSGRTPGKYVISQTGNVQMAPHNFNQSDRDQILAQDTAHLAYGLFGLKFEETAEPRRRLFLRILASVLNVTIIFMDVRYWYTRSSTVSISILGTVLMAGCNLSWILVSAITEGKHKKMTIAGWFVSFLFFTFPKLVSPLLMIKAVMRIEFGWWKGTSWIPIPHRAGATHRERASARIEAKTSLRSVATLLFFLVAIYYALAPHEIFVIPSALPAPSPDDLAKDRLATVFAEFIRPIYVTGRLLQLLLNFRTRSYAGNYKVSTVGDLTVDGIILASFMPVLVGRVDAWPGLSLHKVVKISLNLIAAWQALTLPSISQTLEEEHSQ